MLKLKKIPVKKDDYSKSCGMSDEIPYFAPSFHVSDKQIPEIKDWKVGEKYQMVIEVEMKSMSSHKRDDQEIGTSGSFDVVAYKTANEEISDDDLESLQGKALSNK